MQSILNFVSTDEISNSSANGTMDELRKILGRMNNYKGTVMIYFIGCTRVVRLCCVVKLCVMLCVEW